MTKLERAKQFMPFAALHGYEKIIKDKEKLVVEKVALSDEEAKLLNETFLTIRKGSLVMAEYYLHDKYVITEGIITAIDCALKTLRIVKTDIPFDDLRALKVIK